MLESLSDDESLRLSEDILNQGWYVGELAQAADMANTDRARPLRRVICVVSYERQVVNFRDSSLRFYVFSSRDEVRL